RSDAKRTQRLCTGTMHAARRLHPPSRRRRQCHLVLRKHRAPNRANASSTCARLPTSFCTRLRRAAAALPYRELLTFRSPWGPGRGGGKGLKEAEELLATWKLLGLQGG